MNEKIHSDETREIPPQIEREFSKENIRAYSEMCLDVAMQLIEFAKQKEGDPKERKAILLPSRGAVPIFIGAVLAMRELKRGETEIEDFLSRLELPKFCSFEPIQDIDSLPKDAGRIPILLFPFTADVNFGEKIAPEDADKLVEKMRRFCVRVVGDFYKPLEERDSPEFKRFLKFIKFVSKKPSREKFYQNFPQVDEFLLIDTVISGRAAAAILSEFKEIQKPFKAILVIDAKGEKLRRDYKREFYYEDEVKTFQVPRILTEDRGSALEGVVAVVYPELIVESDKAGKFVSAGDWYDLPQTNRDIYKGVFFSFLELIRLHFIDGVTIEEVEAKRKNFLRQLINGSVLKHEATVDYRDLIPDPTDVKGVKETSSHVVQIKLNPQARISFLQNL